METAAADNQPAASAVASSAPPRGRFVVRLRLPPAWTPEEDAILERLATENRSRHWRRVATQMPRRRSPRQCRDRWRDHLARGVFHRPFTVADDDELASLCLHLDGGNASWKHISRAVHGRSSRAVKLRWRELCKNDEFLRRIWRSMYPMLPAAGQDVVVVDALSPSSPSSLDAVLATEVAVGSGNRADVRPLR